MSQKTTTLKSPHDPKIIEFLKYLGVNPQGTVFKIEIDYKSRFVKVEEERFVFEEKPEWSVPDAEAKEITP